MPKALNTRANASVLNCPCHKCITTALKPTTAAPYKAVTLLLLCQKYFINFPATKLCRLRYQLLLGHAAFNSGFKIMIAICQPVQCYFGPLHGCQFSFSAKSIPLTLGNKQRAG